MQWHSSHPEPWQGAAGGLLAVFQQVVVAEEFRTVVYLSVAVPVPDQKPVIRRNPAEKLGKAVSVVVEEHTRILAQGLDTVTVQIKNNGILTGCAEESLEHVEKVAQAGRGMIYRLTVRCKMSFSIFLCSVKRTFLSSFYLIYSSR